MLKRIYDVSRLLRAAVPLVIGASLACTSTSPVMSTPSTTTWTLVWSDEFAGGNGRRTAVGIRPGKRQNAGA